jgi:hypothetical protein
MPPGVLENVGEDQQEHGAPASCIHTAEKAPHNAVIAPLERDRDAGQCLVGAPPASIYERCDGIPDGGLHRIHIRRQQPAGSLSGKPARTYCAPHKHPRHERRVRWPRLALRERQKLLELKDRHTHVTSSNGFCCHRVPNAFLRGG